MDEYILDAHHLPRGVRIAQEEVADRQGARVEKLVTVRNALIERHGNCEGLEDGAEFINVGHDAVLPVLLRGLLAAVRVEIRQ